MINAARRLPSVHFTISILAGAALGASLGLGIALAQDPASGQLDLECASRCTAHGYDAEFCGQVCWVLDPTIAARSYPVHWPCYASCRERGGKPEDCLPVCRQG